MEKASGVTKLIILGAAVIGAVALALVIVGVSTKNWIAVSSSSSSLEAKLNSVFTNASFIGPLLVATGANQIQVLTIISATVAEVKKELDRGVGKTTYHLFDKTPNASTTPPNFKLPQGLVLAGLASMFVGVLLAIVTLLLSLRRVLRAIPLLFLIVGPILITIGYIFYTKLVIEDFGGVFETSVAVGYSFILVIIASIVGYLAAVFFAFSTLHPLQRSQPRSSAVHVGDTVIVRETQAVVVTTNF
jgi:hypothetical protein